jgi:hypothetical protein
MLRLKTALDRRFQSYESLGVAVSGTSGLKPKIEIGPAGPVGRSMAGPSDADLSAVQFQQ